MTAKQQSNRERAPQCARIVDMLNAAGLGPVRVVMLDEGGVKMQTKDYADGR